MKKAFIVTTFNEEKAIDKLFVSLLNQSLMPDEIIIVDAFSNDSSFEKIVEIKKEFKKRYPSIRFEVYKKKGNRSVGRNFAIKMANSSIIAVSDAGCRLKNDWFLEIVKPFGKKDVNVVAGFYKPQTDMIFEKSLAAYTCIPEEKVDKNYLPSSRSIAFKKNCWEKVGGYPEYLNTCEDLVFARQLKRIGFTFEVCKKAIVYWPQRKNLMQAFNQFFSYAKGDGEAFYIRPSTPFLFLRYIFGIILLTAALKSDDRYLIFFVLALVVCYLLWAISKNYRYIKKPQAVLYLPVLQLTSDVAVILGMSVGLIKGLVFSISHNTNKGPSKVTV
jgi:glycosyltransferase involved in cell wall biosynthesis